MPPFSMYARSKICCIRSVLLTTAPAITSLCPPMYFDAECTTMSTPSVIGFWNSGVAQLLSMQVSAPWARAMPATASMSSGCPPGWPTG